MAALSQLLDYVDFNKRRNGWGLGGGILAGVETDVLGAEWVLMLPGPGS